MEVEIKGKRIGDGQPAFITYEAGPTHSNVEEAKELVRQAARAGADAIKFQIIDPDRLVADRQQPFSYEILVDRESGETEEVTEPLYDILCRRVLTRDEWEQVKKVSDEHGLAFFATITFEDELRFLADLGCDSVKIASGDVNHHPLIKQAAATGMLVQLDTGSSSLGEVEEAVDLIRGEGNKQVLVHHCPSGYPARIPSIHLRMIPTIKQALSVPVAYSDHTPGWEMDVAAVALGANLVEKTISLDRTTRSIEHMFSLEGDELSDFVKIIRDVETALGSARRVLGDEQRRKRDAVRRSAYYKRALRSGEVLRLEDIEFRRPGYGIPPDAYEQLVGAELVCDVAQDQLVERHQLRPPAEN